MHIGGRGCEFIFAAMLSRAPKAFRLLAATGLHKGDRAYQQDQVESCAWPCARAAVLAVVADGMGGKSGGRKAADQVHADRRQMFERYVPTHDDAGELLRQLVLESHLMIKLTAITAEEEPHSTLAAFLCGPGLECLAVHAGDSRVYHFRGAEMVPRAPRATTPSCTRA
jgi:serine/threonine protein phosphatase PrpC